MLKKIIAALLLAQLSAFPAIAEINTDTMLGKVRLKIAQLATWKKKISGLKMTQHGATTDEKAIALNKMHYLRDDSEISKKLKLVVNDEGKLLVGGQEINNFLKREGIINKQKYEIIFIMENDGDIYVYDPEILQLPHNDIIFHSSLVKDEWPVAAGTLIVKHGEIRSINNDSGHFAPKFERLDLVEKKLKSMNADMESYEEPTPINGRPDGDSNRVSEESNKRFRDILEGKCR